MSRALESCPRFVPIAPSALSCFARRVHEAGSCLEHPFVDRHVYGQPLGRLRISTARRAAAVRHSRPSFPKIWVSAFFSIEGSLKDTPTSNTPYGSFGAAGPVTPPPKVALGETNGPWSTSSSDGTPMGVMAASGISCPALRGFHPTRVDACGAESGVSGFRFPACAAEASPWFSPRVTSMFNNPSPIPPCLQSSASSRGAPLLRVRRFNEPSTSG